MSVSTVPSFITLLQQHASPARYHRATNTGPICPCRTPEGFRDPEFHLSMKKYGPISYEVEAGPIPVSTLLYSFVGVNDANVSMSPPILTSSITSDNPFQVKFTVLFPKQQSISAFAVYRGVDGAGAVKISDVPRPVVSDLEPTAIFTDNIPLGTVGPSFIEPMLCNEVGRIPAPPDDFMVKAFCQPIQSTRATRLSTEYIEQVFGNVEADDHLGIFPIIWGGRELFFSEWSQSGDDFIEYDGERFMVINANKIPDPGDGNPDHHWEVGLRKIDEQGLSS